MHMCGNLTSSTCKSIYFHVIPQTVFLNFIHFSLLHICILLDVNTVLELIFVKAIRITCSK